MKKLVLLLGLFPLFSCCNTAADCNKEYNRDLSEIRHSSADSLTKAQMRAQAEKDRVDCLNE